MTPAQVAHIMELVRKVIDHTACKEATEALAAYTAVEAALRDAPQQAEPVHWRALLDPAQRPQKLQTHHHVVGFTSYKACEAFVASELDMNGWRYTIEPLYNRPPATPSAPTAVEPDERHNFEAAYRARYPVSCDLDPAKFNRSDEGDYEDIRVSIAWAMWQARALKGTPL